MACFVCCGEDPPLIRACACTTVAHPKCLVRCLNEVDSWSAGCPVCKTRLRNVRLEYEHERRLDADGLLLFGVYVVTAGTAVFYIWLCLVRRIDWFLFAVVLVEVFFAGMMLLSHLGAGARDSNRVCCVATRRRVRSVVPMM